MERTALIDPRIRDEKLKKKIKEIQNHPEVAQVVVILWNDVERMAKEECGKEVTES